VSATAGASTAITGESAEAGGSTNEEVVAGNVPVSQGAGVVEQGVQVEQPASDQAGYQEGYRDQYPNGQNQQGQQ